MSYIQEFELELVKLLQSTKEPSVIVKWVSEKVLESYKNGISAGKNRKHVIRKDASGQSAVPSQAL